MKLILFFTVQIVAIGAMARELPKEFDFKPNESVHVVGDFEVDIGAAGKSGLKINSADVSIFFGNNRAFCGKTTSASFHVDFKVSKQFLGWILRARKGGYNHTLTILVCDPKVKNRCRPGSDAKNIYKKQFVLNFETLNLNKSDQILQMGNHRLSLK